MFGTERDKRMWEDGVQELWIMASEFNSRTDEHNHRVEISGKNKPSIKTRDLNTNKVVLTETVTNFISLGLTRYALQLKIDSLLPTTKLFQ